MQALCLSDFADEQGDIDPADVPAMQAFVALAQLTTVLSSSLDRLYTVRSSPCIMSAETALLHASQCQDQLRAWLNEVPLSLESPGPMINSM